MNLNSAALFIKVIQYGSFSETARKTNIPVSTVSRRIKELEKELGVKLLERSTRYICLTDIGLKFFEYAEQGVEAFETGLSTINHCQIDISGTLRLSLPPGFVPWRKLLRDFHSNYPQVNIEIYITERKVDLIEDGIDVALRIGNIKSKQAISERLGEYRHLLVASPILLEKKDVLLKPHQLLDFPCACWKSIINSSNWQLGDKIVQINPLFHVNDYLHLLDLALSGICITELPPFLAQEYIANGKLKKLLVDFPLPLYELNLLYPSRRQLSSLVKTYIDFCSAWVDDLLNLV